MTTELHTNSDERQSDERQSLSQAGQPAGTSPVAPLTSPADTGEESAAKEESPIQSVPPPTPPTRGIVARVQRMPPTGRWALGLGLAFLSGLATLVLSFGGSAVAILTMFVLALAAGFVLTSWWAVLALAAAAAVGGLAGGGIVTLMTPGGSMAGLTGMGLALGLFAFFVILGLAPLIIFLIAGVGLGKWQGLTLEPSRAPSTREVRVGRWIAALGPLIAGGFLAPQLSNFPGMVGMSPMPLDVLSTLSGVFYAIVLAATCLLAGWVLRSWWGLALTVGVYVGAAALWFGMGDLFQLGASVGFALYIVLPAVVMSAIGTAIGMNSARRREQPPQPMRPALPAT